jgi:hypothetical protein
MDVRSYRRENIDYENYLIISKIRSRISNVRKNYGAQAKEFNLEKETVGVRSFFLIRIVGNGVQLGPLGTSATDWPIVPVPGEYGDEEFGGMKIGK